MLYPGASTSNRNQQGKCGVPADAPQWPHTGSPLARAEQGLIEEGIDSSGSFEMLSTNTDITVA